MIVETVKPNPSQINKYVLFSSEQEEMIYKKASDNISSKESLIKTYIDLVAKMAHWYALENGKSFAQMLKIGEMAVIKAIERFNNSMQIGFANYVSHEILKAMMEESRS